MGAFWWFPDRSTTLATSDERNPDHGSADPVGTLHRYGDRSVDESQTFYVLGIPPSVPAMLSSESRRNSIVLRSQTTLSALSRDLQCRSLKHAELGALTPPISG